MSKAIWFISYKLKKDASTEDFLLAQKECHDQVLSKKKGFISWQALSQGDTWVDLVTWETMEDAIAAENDGSAPEPAAAKFYSFLNFNSMKMQAYTIEKDYSI